MIHEQCVNFLQASLGHNRNELQPGDGGDPAGEGARGAGGEAREEGAQEALHEVGLNTEEILHLQFDVY